SSGVAGILAHRPLRRPFSFLFYSCSLLGDGAGVPPSQERDWAFHHRLSPPTRVIATKVISNPPPGLLAGSQGLHCMLTARTGNLCPNQRRGTSWFQTLGKFGQANRSSSLNTPNDHRIRVGRAHINYRGSP